MKPLNTADFGKVMKRAFPNVKPRRLGQRGQSKYCYSGLRKRLELQPPSLPDLAEGFDQAGVDAQKTHEEELMPECIALICEWAENLLGRGFTNIRDLAEHLLSNLYVNSKSTAAFALTAAMQKTKTSDSKVPVSSLFASKPGGGKHTDTQIQLQRRIQERQLIGEQKKKIQQQREEIGKQEPAELGNRRRSIKTKLFSPPVGTFSSTQTTGTSSVSQAGFGPMQAGPVATDICDFGMQPKPGSIAGMPDAMLGQDWKQLPSCTQNLLQGNMPSSGPPPSTLAMTRSHLESSPSSAFMPVAGSPVGKGKQNTSGTSTLEALLNDNPMNKMKMHPMDPKLMGHLPPGQFPPHIKMEGNIPMGHMPHGPMQGRPNLPNMSMGPGHDIRPPMSEAGMIRGPGGMMPVAPHQMHQHPMAPHQQSSARAQKLKFTPIKPKTPSGHAGKTVSEILKDVRGYGPDVIDSPFYSDMRPVSTILKESRDKMGGPAPPGMHQMTPAMKRSRNNSSDDIPSQNVTKRQMMESYGEHLPTSAAQTLSGRVLDDVHNLENDALLDYLDSPGDQDVNHPPPPYPGRPLSQSNMPPMHPGNFVTPQGRAIHRQHSTGRRSPDPHMQNPNLFMSPKPQKIVRNPGNMPSPAPGQHAPRSSASSLPYQEHPPIQTGSMPPNFPKSHGMPSQDPDAQFELFLNQSPQRSPARRNFPPLPGDPIFEPRSHFDPQMHRDQGMPRDHPYPGPGNFPPPPHSTPHLSYTQSVASYTMTQSQPSPHSNPSSQSSHSLISPRPEPSPLAPPSTSPPTPSQSQRSSTSTPPPLNSPPSHAERGNTQGQNPKKFSNVPTSQNQQWSNVNVDSPFSGPRGQPSTTSAPNLTFTDVMLQSKGLVPRTPIVPPRPPVSSFGMHNITDRISNQISNIGNQILCMTTHAPSTPGVQHSTFSPAQHGGCGIWPNIQGAYRQLATAVTHQPHHPMMPPTIRTGLTPTGLTPPSVKRNLGEALDNSAEGGLNISDDLQSTLDVLRDFDTQYFTQGEQDNDGNNSGSKGPHQGLNIPNNPLSVDFSPGIAAEFPNIFGHEKRSTSENQVVPPEGMSLTPESDILCYDNIGVQKLARVVTTH
ncbi:uncharacterized protein LOC135498721 [Lineus longissimus]|uniref:uncharacterized protein LOC135498721 n=1 Tax=Lineus longissimus TaxID=88925 RepID=UPI00315D63CC